MPQTIGMEASRATLPRSSESIGALASKLINPEKSLTVIIRSGRVGRSIEVLEDRGDRPRTMALFPECEGLLPDASIVRLKPSQLRLSQSWQRYRERCVRLLAYEQAVFWSGNWHRRRRGHQWRRRADRRQCRGGAVRAMVCLFNNAEVPAVELATFDHPAGARVHLAAESPFGHPPLVLQARRGRLI
jgi:hypothetical protein